ncbi:DUF4013 domain-containing protein [Berryella wangjianweii]|uniref:DUF4013 domain-containing protein n=1 Tax=Berryella wangjianweii TaxID=2734634 RepID=A0A6M8J523_9ACTN|nr:DUF4013 domain-containing protein [Berryella wangjianweii]QKF07723.1 DUF4013 domain-containing protein [Berryella wangjianweii]
MSNVRYFDASWRDLTKSEGWFKKMMLLGLVSIVPIFGSIVTNGYLYGWARDCAWGVRTQLPARIFGNEDGKLYRRGFFIFVIGIVAAAIPWLISQFIEISTGFGSAAILNSLTAHYLPSYNDYGMSGVDSFARLTWTPAVITAIMVGGLASVVFSIIGTLYCFVASMRSSIYDNLSSGFQFGKIFAMIKHDAGGMARIFVMALLADIVCGLILGLVTVLIMLVGVFMFAGLMVGASSGSEPSLGFVMLMVFLVMVVLAALFYFFAVLQAIVQALVARALGYWTAQFDVPSWGAQTDPMPFERMPAVGAQAPEAPMPSVTPEYTPPVAPTAAAPASEAASEAVASQSAAGQDASAADAVAADAPIADAAASASQQAAEATQAPVAEAAPAAQAERPADEQK